jgi:hypothetical protein
MKEAAFEAEVSAGVESMIEQLGDRATDQARVDLLRALDDGAPEVAVAYEICLRLIERQSRHLPATLPVAAEPGMLGWLRSWFPPAKPTGAAFMSKVAH